MLSHCGFDFRFPDGSCKEYETFKIILYCKDKLKYIKILKASLRKHQFELCSAKPEVVKSTPPTGSTGSDFHREKAEAKQGRHQLALA